jgi:hypothetical protein
VRRCQQAGRRSKNGVRPTGQQRSAVTSIYEKRAHNFQLPDIFCLGPTCSLLLSSLSLHFTLSSTPSRAHPLLNLSSLAIHDGVLSRCCWSRLPEFPCSCEVGGGGLLSLSLRVRRWPWQGNGRRPAMACPRCPLAFLWLHGLGYKICCQRLGPFSFRLS